MIVRFAAGWALLFVMVMLVGVLTYVVFTEDKPATKADVARIEQKLNPGALQAYKDACGIQIQGAASAGVTLVECKLAQPKFLHLKHNPDVHGDHASVGLVVKSINGDVWLTFVELDKSSWSQSDYKITPIAEAPPTIESPQ